MQSDVRVLVYLLMFFSVYFLTGAAQQVSWSNIVSYQGKDGYGEDLFGYEKGWLEDFFGSVKTYEKNKTQEALKRVHELQKLIFPYTKPLLEKEVESLEKELYVMDTGEQMSRDSLLVKRLFEPSQEGIKCISVKRGLVK